MSERTPEQITAELALLPADTAAIALRMFDAANGMTTEQREEVLRHGGANLASRQEPSKPKRGRPAKAKPAEIAPKKRGRPRKVAVVPMAEAVAVEA